MFKNGVHREVVMDNHIPCLNGAPCFSKANGNELWVIILEKAWAKMLGTYEATAGRHAVNALHAFTGAPVFQHLTSA